MIIFNQWRFNTTPLHSNPGSKHGSSYKSHRNDCGSPGHNTPRWEATITRIQPSQSAPKSWPWVCVGGICPGGSVLVGLSWWDLSTSATLGETEVMEEKEEHGVTQMRFSNVSVAQGSVIPSLGRRGLSCTGWRGRQGRPQNSCGNECRRLLCLPTPGQAQNDPHCHKGQIPNQRSS